MVTATTREGGIPLKGGAPSSNGGPTYRQLRMTTVLGEDPAKTVYPPEDGAFGLAEGDFMESHILTRYGEALLKECPELFDAAGYRILFRWRRKGGKSGGRPTMSRAELIKGWAFHLSEGTADVGVWVAADHCRKQLVGAMVLERYLYRALCSIQVEEDDEGNRTLKIVKPEVELFVPEIDRYGVLLDEDRRASAAFERVRAVEVGA